MKDSRGVELAEGDYVVYPVKTGSGPAELVGGKIVLLVPEHEYRDWPGHQIEAKVKIVRDFNSRFSSWRDFASAPEKPVSVVATNVLKVILP